VLKQIPLLRKSRHMLPGHGRFMTRTELDEHRTVVVTRSEQIRVQSFLSSSAHLRRFAALPLGDNARVLGGGPDAAAIVPAPNRRHRHAPQEVVSSRTKRSAAYQQHGSSQKSGAALSKFSPSFNGLRVLLDANADEIDVGLLSRTALSKLQVMMM
jgi:hypothetical protein